MLYGSNTRYFGRHEMFTPQGAVVIAATCGVGFVHWKKGKELTEMVRMVYG